MNAYERVMCVFEKQKPDCCPVIPLVREWCSKQVGFTIIQDLSDIDTHIKVQIDCYERFGYDAVFGECYACHSESEAMGSKLKIVDGMLPSVVEHAVNDYEKDLPSLKLVDPHVNERLSTLLKSARRLKEKCKNEVPVISYVQAPFRHASMLRGAENVMRDLYKNKENLRALCEIALYSQVNYATALIDAGADILFISDPTSSGDAVSEKQWREWGLVYTKRLVDIVKRSGVKTFLHICGKTQSRVESLAETGVDGLSLDSSVDFGQAREVLGPDYLLIGNIDTNLMAFGKPEAVAEATRKVIEAAGENGNLIVSTGCLIADICPAENIEALVKTAHDYVY